MKRLITIFATMLGVACGTATQNSLTIEEIDAELTTMLMKERETLLEIVNKTYGPMTIEHVHDNNRWTWVDGPWPWEPDAN